MDGINLMFFSALDDPFDIKKFRNRLIIFFREIDDFIRFFQVPGVWFFGSFYHVRPNSHFPGGLNDPDGNFAPVGYE